MNKLESAAVSRRIKPQWLTGRRLKLSEFSFQFFPVGSSMIESATVPFSNWRKGPLIPSRLNKPEKVSAQSCWCVSTFRVNAAEYDSGNGLSPLGLFV